MTTHINEHADDSEEDWDKDRGITPFQWVSLAILVIIVAFSMLNASWLAGKQPGRLELIAHNGIYQAPADGAADLPCPSTRIAADQPHNFISHSLSGINFAWSRRAQMVEVDIRPTADGRLVLFGEESIDCRTDGQGDIADLTLEELQQLDIGYNLTPDGADFPLRGRDIGMLASVEQAITISNDVALLFNFVDPDPAQAQMLAAAYERADREMGDGVIIMGSPELLDAVNERFPQARLLNIDAAEACFDAYMWSGWYGSVPEICRGSFISVPLDRQWMLWGWPNRFLARMRANDVTPMVVATHDGDAIVPLSDFDQVSDVPQDFRGMLWLSDIYRMGPSIRP